MAALPYSLPGVVAPHDGLVLTATAQGAATAWAMLRLARTAIAHDLVADAGLCIVCLSMQARTASAPVARRIRRDLPGLAGTLAVSHALLSPPALGATLPHA